MVFSLSPYGVEAHIPIIRIGSWIFADLYWCYDECTNEFFRRWYFLQLVEDPTPPSSRMSYIVFERGRCIPFLMQRSYEGISIAMSRQLVNQPVTISWETVLIRDIPVLQLLPGAFKAEDVSQSILRVPIQFPLNTPFRFDDHSAQQFVRTCDARVVQVENTSFSESTRICSRWTSASDSQHLVQVGNTIISEFSRSEQHFSERSWSDAFDVVMTPIHNMSSLESSRIYSHWTTAYTFTTPQHCFTIRVGQCHQTTSLAAEECPETYPITMAPVWATFHAGTTTEVKWQGDYSKTKELLESIPKNGQHCCRTDHVVQWPQVYNPYDRYNGETFRKKFCVAKSGSVTLSFTYCPINPGQTLVLKASSSGLVCIVQLFYAIDNADIVGTELESNWN